MKKVNYLILGAGPAGLTFANQLLQHGETDFLVLEKEEEAGGLCRSRVVDGAPLDIGGGHFLDVRSPEVDRFLFGFLPREEWNLFTRISKIRINGQLIDHPFEANIWEMPPVQQEAYLQSVQAAGSNQDLEKPELFVDWIIWKLGSKIADDYMLPYNRKMFCENLDELGTYWLNKLPDVSYEEILRSCREHRAFGTQPGHAHFYYPKKYGYGELWRRMGEALGERLLTEKEITGIDTYTRTVFCRDKFTVSAEHIIMTIPWDSVQHYVGLPQGIAACIDGLRHCGTQIAYQKDHLDTDAHWIYEPDPQKSYHRILVRHNFLPGSAGYWTETNQERIDTDTRPHDFCYLNTYAYPLNTIQKPEEMAQILEWAHTHRIYGLGRWGEHRHFNSDVTVERAIALYEKLCGKGRS